MQKVRTNQFLRPCIVSDGEVKGSYHNKITIMFELRSRLTAQHPMSHLIE